MNISSNNHKFINVTLSISLVLFLFILMSILIHSPLLKVIDTAAHDWFLNHSGSPVMNFHSGWLTGYFTIFARYCDIPTIIVITIFIAIYYFIRKQYLLSVWMMSTVGFGGILGIIMKHMVHRERPVNHLALDSGFSFPSGHSLASTMLVMIVLLLIINIKKTSLRLTIRYATLIIWISILVSRLYFNAHYLSDVVGGVTFSAFWVLLLFNLYLFINEKVTNKISRNKPMMNTHKTI
ncbi:phosphatase PAP2 family protein [Mammaliicoccus sp. Dog046]|uniref:phosphatase PAP2 family protein n=1 Tax=Mammaliicoccus sp. Dog046 TaxID=3034233 RepID=UPI002B25AB18|nr:phosphatase PAP2 family protein [Mammaliicoccus sp. Dog046]WQK85159.1 phosphatase PAP2 family protein [Mammaliicoccus sp. Dog046]